RAWIDTRIGRLRKNAFRVGSGNGLTGLCREPVSEALRVLLNQRNLVVVKLPTTGRGDGETPIGLRAQSLRDVLRGIRELMDQAELLRAEQLILEHRAGRRMLVEEGARGGKIAAARDFGRALANAGFRRDADAAYGVVVDCSQHDDVLQ